MIVWLAELIPPNICNNPALQDHALYVQYKEKETVNILNPTLYSTGGAIRNENELLFLILSMYGPNL